MYSIEQCDTFTKAIQAKVWTQDYTKCLESPMWYMNMWMVRTAKLAEKSFEYSGKYILNGIMVPCFCCKQWGHGIQLVCEEEICDTRWNALPPNKQHWLTYCFSMGIKYCLSPVKWKEQEAEVKLSNLELGAFDL